MSLWSSFLDNIAKPVGGAIAKIPETFIGTFTGNLASPSQAISNIAISAGVDIGTSKQLTALGLEKQAQNIVKENLKYSVKNQATSNDLVLQAGVKLHDEVISPYVTRPIASAALLTDLDSPLYSDEFTKGFQLSDITEAYNRSEEVSLGQALTKSDLNPIKEITNLVFDKGGIDLDQVDLWNDDDIQRAFVDNTVGKYFTGITDFTVSNLAIGGAFGLAAKSGYLSARKAGLTTKANNFNKIEKDIDDGILYTQSSAASGRQTTIGNDINKLASTSDIEEVSTILNKYTNNINLYGPIQRATNPNTVKDLILADKGYLPALDRLSKNVPADLYEIADMNSVFRARRIEEGKPLEFSDEAWTRLNAAFDDAIARVPEYQFIKDALLDSKTGTPTMFGRDYVPMEPVIGKGAFIKTREKFQDLKTASVTRDFTKLGGIEERILGRSLNGPITKIVRFVGTEKPLGFVTYSGARPLDGLKEIDAWFDDIDLFRNGSNLIKITPRDSISAGEYRTQIKSEFVNAKTNIERNNILDKLDDQMGLIIGYTKGFSDAGAIKSFTTEIKNQIFGATNSIAQKGYGMDAQGERILVNPQTQRQLIDSRRMIPWGIIERELNTAIQKSKSKKALDVTNDAIKFFYETFTKYWTIGALGRLTYIPKNSLFEPSLSSMMAFGNKAVIDGVPTMSKNFLFNNKQRVLGTANKVLNKKEFEAVDKAVNDLTNQLNEAVNLLDNLTAHAALYLEPEKYGIKLSPKTLKDNRPLILADLKAASKLVDDIEFELRDAVRPFAKMSTVPSIASLERRVQFLESLPGGTAKYGAQIANAKSAITKAKGSIHTLTPDSKEILAANKEIARQYKEIDDIYGQLGKARTAQADVYLKDAAYKERRYGKPKQYRMIAGQWIPFDSLFSKNQFGSSFTPEFSNSRTMSAGYLGEVGLGVHSNLILRRGPSTVTFVNDPLYFDELAFFVNRSLRGDKLIDRIFARNTEKELIDWGLTSEGKTYFQQFGEVTPSFIVETVRDRIGLVNRYLPNVEAQALALSKEVNSSELAKILGDQLNRLSPIHPLDFNVHTASEFGYSNLNKIEGAISRGASKVFSYLTRPENPIRFATADMFFADALAKRANRLAEQGMSFVKKDGTTDFDRINSLRAAATRDALEANEKTFYTIRRQNRALYAARVATAFPTASLNAFYRYGRFTLKNPERVGQFLYNYQAAFRSFGVDQYGNPTDDPMKATHLVVPGTKEMGFFGDKGIRLNARSIGFLLNYPSPSIFSNIAVSEIYKRKPDMEDLMKSWLGSNYDVLFPYGPQTDWTSSFVPRWAKDAWFYLNGPEGNQDFLNSWKDVHNYYRTLDELGITKYPGAETVYRDTRKNFAVRAGWSFASIFGAPAKVDTNPMAIYEDAYDLLVNKYRMIANNEKTARELAGAEFTAKMGANFPLDRVTFKGSSARSYIAPNYESYKRIFEDSTGLAEKLASQNPELVGLLGLDVDMNKEEFNLSVYRILNDPETKLPDGSLLNNLKLNPKQEEQKRQVNRAWALYNEVTDKLKEVAADRRENKSLRSYPDLLEARRTYAREYIRSQSEDWWTEYNDAVRGDKSFRYAYGLNEIVNNKAWMEKYGKTKVWEDISTFMEIRNTVVSAYQGLPYGSPNKSTLKNNYIDYIDDISKTWHPKVQLLINRYFEEDTMKDATKKDGSQ
jgi:hypothetical protein